MVTIGPRLNNFQAARKTLAKGRISNSIKDKILRKELSNLAESYSKGSLSQRNLLKEVDRLSKTPAAANLASAKGTAARTALLLLVVLMILTNFAATTGDTPTGKKKKKGTDTKQEVKPKDKPAPKKPDPKPIPKPDATKPEDKAKVPDDKGIKKPKKVDETPKTKKKGDPPKAKTVAEFLKEAQLAGATAKAETESIETEAQKKIADLQLGVQGLRDGIVELKGIIRTLKTGNAKERQAAFKKYYKKFGRVKAMGPGVKLTEATVKDKYAPESITNLEEGIKEEETKIAGVQTQAEKDKVGHQAVVDDATKRGKAATNIQFFWAYLKDALKNMTGPLPKRLLALGRIPSHADLKLLEKDMAILTDRAKVDAHKRYGSAMLVYIKVMLMNMEHYPKDFAVATPNPGTYLPQVKSLVATIKELDKKVGNTFFHKQSSDEIQKIFTSE